MTNEARENVTNVTGAGVGGGRKVNLSNEWELGRGREVNFSLIDDREAVFQDCMSLGANRWLLTASRGKWVKVRVGMVSDDGGG